MPISVGTATLAAGAIGASGGFLGQSDTNQTNKDIAAANNATQINLANTAYQRRVAGLQAAGLNPMLAYTQGGASTPGGASAQHQSETEGMSKSALDVILAKETINNMRTQSALNQATADYQRAQSVTSGTAAALNRQITEREKYATALARDDVLRRILILVLLLLRFMICIARIWLLRFLVLLRV